MGLISGKKLTWLNRNRGGVIFALTVFVMILGMANALKHGLVSAQWLRDQKDTFSVLNSCVTMIILVIGAGFSYYRFFRGRTLSLRLEVSISVSVHDTPLDDNLHALTITAKNVGTSAVWDPRPVVKLKIHGPPDAESIWIIDEWESEEGKGETLAIIESGEAATFFALQSISKRAWAVTYFASVAADQGDVWHISKTFSNLASRNLQE